MRHRQTIIRYPTIYVPHDNGGDLFALAWYDIEILSKIVVNFNRISKSDLSSPSSVKRRSYEVRKCRMYFGNCNVS